MAQQRSTATLRAISYRITSTPTKQLPLLASQLCGLIWNCKEILSTPADTVNADAEVATLVHRLKTSLSSLLQDRTIEGRWAAVVVAKATLEAGGVEVLSKSNGWVRNLLAILKKNDPASTKVLAVITLTRIFALTWEYTNLVREITTPALPSFISTCLANGLRDNCCADGLQAILEAFTKLLPRHPTIFRTHENQIRQLLSRILSSGSSSGEDGRCYTTQHVCYAQRLLVLLYHCAPKQGGSEQWDRTFQASITAAHATCNNLFRSVIEEWQSTASEPTSAPPKFSTTEATYEQEDALELSPWQGMLAGSDRLVVIFGVLNAHVELATSTAVPVRLGRLIDLLTRVLSVKVPERGEILQPNPQVSKDERETLLVLLPTVHVAAVGLMESLLKRFGQASSPFLQSLMELLIDVYHTESFDDGLRKATYRCLEQMLKLNGPSLPGENVTELRPILKHCCNHIFVDEPAQPGVNGGSKVSPELVKDAAFSIATINKSASISGLASSATALLTTAINKLNPAYVPRQLRADIERTALRTRNKGLLLACVMNPARKDADGKLKPSLLPLLAKQFPDAVELEALLRPRFPPVGLQAGVADEDVNDVVNEASENDEDQEIAMANGHTSNTDAEAAVSGGADRAADPTTDLLNALTQPAGGAPQSVKDVDLHTETPPRTVNDTAARLTAKRLADGGVEDSVTAKRLRASPVAEALAEGTRSDLPGPDPAIAAVGVPVTVELGEDAAGVDRRTTMVTKQPSPPQSSGNVYSTAPEIAGDGSDDSDFEMPPLTMEPDTDPEDEDDED